MIPSYEAEIIIGIEPSSNLGYSTRCAGSKSIPQISSLTRMKGGGFKDGSLLAKTDKGFMFPQLLKQLIVYTYDYKSLKAAMFSSRNLSTNSHLRLSSQVQKLPSMAHGH